MAVRGIVGGNRPLLPAFVEIPVYPMLKKIVFI